MIMAKFLTTLFVLVLLAGCTFPCVAPDRPQYKSCIYALEVTDKPAGKNFALGKIPKAVVDKNREHQEKRGEEVDYSNYPFDEEYRIHVEDLSKLEVGKIYMLRSVPSDILTFDNKLDIRKPVSEQELDEILSGHDDDEPSSDDQEKH